jgi:DNA helicase-2/ATP-dependent DNA helicase PcrA
MDDVLATVALRRALAPRAAIGLTVRQRLIAKYAAGFLPLRRLFSDPALAALRPGERLAALADRSGLRAGYSGEPERLARLDELRGRLARADDPALPPEAALRAAIDRAALARDVDGIGDVEGVRVITVHQSKGLEFDEVFVGGLAENSFPSYFAVKEGKVDEECRLFYVAATRARRRLHLSWPERNANGFACRKSRFLA